jgi:rRNA pseudouridine-1189 N-methylase Emg1 (Nep1/Mra1 family)
MRGEGKNRHLIDLRRVVKAMLELFNKNQSARHQTTHIALLRLVETPLKIPHHTEDFIE